MMVSIPTYAADNVLLPVKAECPDGEQQLCSASLTGGNPCLLVSKVTVTVMVPIPTYAADSFLVAEAEAWTIDTSSVLLWIAMPA